ncbi:MAG: GNAT family N-acetyltransferase [Clostridia bacterium]|nr:GNAT family N-acetyltransferase [Clostridia bacterium]
MKELETKRLILRYLKGDDWRGLYDAWSDDEVTKYLTFDTYSSVEDAKERVGIWLDRYKEEKCYRWIIERREDGEIFGVIDVVGYSADGAPEIGYLSRRRYWGCGYMTEALGAVTEYLFSEGYHAVVVEAAVDNVGSNRVIQKNGYTFTGNRFVEYSKRGGSVRHKINSYRKVREEG